MEDKLTKSQLRALVANYPYAGASLLGGYIGVSAREIVAACAIHGVRLPISCSTSPCGVTPAPQRHTSSKTPSSSAMRAMLWMEPTIDVIEFCRRYGVTRVTAYAAAKKAGVKFARRKKGPGPSDEALASVKVGDVYHFANRVTLSYDDRGKRIDHLCGPTHQILPRLRAAGWNEPVEVLPQHVDANSNRPAKRPRKKLPPLTDDSYNPYLPGNQP